MRIHIDNKEYLTDPDIVFLSDAVMRYKNREDGVVAFVNHRIVARTEWDKTRIKDGDDIIVIFAKP